MSESEMEKVICFVESPNRVGTASYNNGYVLKATGPVFEYEMSQQGRNLEDWAIIENSPDGYFGILVWEGECENKWCMNHGADWEPRLRGAWRKPTAVELIDLVKGAEESLASSLITKE